MHETEEAQSEVTHTPVTRKGNFFTTDDVKGISYDPNATLWSGNKMAVENTKEEYRGRKIDGCSAYSNIKLVWLSVDRKQAIKSSRVETDGEKTTRHDRERDKQAEREGGRRICTVAQVVV